MVAVMAEEVDADDRPVHHGCMAGFLHLFDRPQILSGRRLHHSPRRLLSSSTSGSATPSERSMQLGDRFTPAPSSPDTTPPPAAPRPSLQLPPLDLKLKDAGAVGAAPSWRLPRLSLDSRAVVDGRGKYRPREIRTPSPAAAPPSPCADDRRSPSVVARLMGLDALPHGQQGDDGATAPACGPGELRRSASERVPRGGDPSRFRFVDPAFFERPSSPQPPPRERQRPSPPPAATEAAARWAADPVVGPRGGGGIGQRRSRFDAREVFPEPTKPAAAAAGEIALYGEIERRLRKRGIAEPARDLETLKQVLEALQLKGLLRHTAAAPPPSPPPPSAVRTPPPIVVMRPLSHRAPSPQQRHQSPSAARRDRGAARRPRSPDPSPARSPASPARRGGPQSPQRRVSSPAQSPKQQPPFRKATSTFDAAGARSRIARRAAQNSGLLLFPDEEASTTTFSDGGSSGGSFTASSRWDFDTPQVIIGDETSRKLERCGKLLSSIHAFTGGDAAAAAMDQQPSPVSVLDAAAFLADEDSPSSSSGSKRAIDFNMVRSPTTKPPSATVSDPEDEEWALGSWTVDPNAGGGDPDYAYVAELVRLFLVHRRRVRDPADVYKVAEQRLHPNGGEDTCQHRLLLCGAVAEALDRQRCACPWDPASWLRGGELVGHVWAEVRRSREPVPAQAAAEEMDLNDVTCSAIRRDLVAADDGAWASSTLQQPRRRPGPEVADAVLQIERLVFKDLVADTIRELSDADRLLPRRKLVF